MSEKRNTPPPPPPPPRPPSQPSHRDVGNNGNKPRHK